MPLYCNQENSSEPNVLLEKRTNRGKFRIWTARETLAEGRKKKVKDSDLAFITKNKPQTKSKDDKNKLLISPKWKVLMQLQDLKKAEIKKMAATEYEVNEWLESFYS